MSVHVMPVKQRLSKSRVLMGASAAVIGWAVSTAALALPGTPTIFNSSGGVGVAATFTPGTGTLTIDQNHERVVIDWTSFDIAAGESVNFVQDQANWIAFNRVDASTFTTIDGSITGLGSVWIFSPAGMLIGSNASINVGSFVAGLGIFDNFQATEAMGLSDPGVFIGFNPPIANSNTLTIDAGASITGTDFIILQGAQIDTAGDLVSSGGVAFINSEAAGIDFNAASPSGIALTNVYASWDPAGRGTPFLNHSGTTTAAWVDLQFGQMFDANYEEIINLDGVITATGPGSGLLNRPANTAIFVGGINSVTGLTGGRSVLLNVLGEINATNGEVNLQATDVFFVDGSTVDVGAAFKTFTYGDITIQGDITATGQIIIHSQAENADILIESTAAIEATAANIDISGNRDNATVSVFGELTASNNVNVRSKGDVYIGATAVLTGNSDDSVGPLNFGVTLQSGLGFDFNTQTMTSIGAGDVTVASGAVIDGSAVNHPTRVFMGANNGDVNMAGSVTGSRVTLVASNDIVVSGDITASEAVQILSFNQATPGIGGDITISGEVVADDLVTLWARYTGNVTVESGAIVVSDADGAPTTNIFGQVADDLVYVTADGFITIEDNALIAGGYAGTSVVVLQSYGDDDAFNEIASIEVSGEIISSGGEIYSEYGSVRLNDGADVTATSAIFSISGGTFVVIEAGAVVHGAGEVDMGFPLLDVEGEGGIAILGSDVAIAGEIYADNIIIGVRDLDPENVAYLGGVDDAITFAGYDLGDDFRLSQEEVDHLHTPTLLIASGADGIDVAVNGNNDLIVEDLTLASSVTTLALGTGQDGAIIFTGDLTPGNSSTDLWVGFASTSGLTLEDRTFIPGTIAILGSIGSEADPFELVNLHASGDILMGSEEFLTEAAEDPEFDALRPNDLDVEYGHIFIATEQLQLAALGRIIQQNTAESPTEFSGIIFKVPDVGYELIYAPDELEGFTVGGSNAWTVNFTAGPTKVQLFGVAHTETAPVTGFDVADQPNLLDPDIEENDAFSINSCRFGSNLCNPSGTNEIDPFETPTDIAVDDIEPAEEELTAEEEEAAEDQAASEDQDSELFRSLVAPGADRAYEQERIGEPITGSGNEDLWTGRGDGVRP